MSGERVTAEAMLEAALDDLEAAEAYGDALEAAVRNRHRATAAVLDLTAGVPRALAANHADPGWRTAYAGHLLDELESRADEVSAFTACFASGAPPLPASDLAAAVAGLGVAFTPPRDGAPLPVALGVADATRLAGGLAALAADDPARQLRLRRHRGLAQVRVRGNPAPLAVDPSPRWKPLLEASRGVLLPGRAPGIVADCWLPLAGQPERPAGRQERLSVERPAKPVAAQPARHSPNPTAVRVLKFVLAPGADVTEVETASPPVWLSAAWQRGRLVVWAEAAVGEGCSSALLAVPTGAAAPEGWTYVGTAQHPTPPGGWPLVVHVYAQGRRVATEKTGDAASAASADVAPTDLVILRD